MAAPVIPYVIPGTVDHVADKPEIVCRVAFDSASTSDPLTWVDMSDRLRSFQIDRGGENELELVDTGTATVILDNTDRALDPFNTSSPYSPNVKPRRRLWLQGQFGGETHDLFYGWTGGFKPEWDDFGDAVVSLSAQDGFEMLAADALPTSNPARDSYIDVAASDDPWGAWELGEAQGTKVVVHLKKKRHKRKKKPKRWVTKWRRWTTVETEADVEGVSGASGTYINTPALGADGLIVGETDTAVNFRSAQTEWVRIPLQSDDLVRNVFSLEVWVRPVAASVDGSILIGPVGPGGGGIWGLQQVTASNNWRTFSVIDGGGTTVTVSGGDPVAGEIAHVVATCSASTLTLYVNGVSVGSSAIAFSSSTIGANPAIQIAAGVGGTQSFNGVVQKVAVYEHVLGADRVLAHYEAGAAMGRVEENTGDRIESMLALSSAPFLPRRLHTGERDILPIYFVGQDPGSEIEEAISVEGDPSLFFFGKDGAAVFLNNDHRNTSPWNTVQATFDDDGTDLPYADLDIDDGEAFIYNDVRVTALGGPVEQIDDTASVAEYQRRVLDLGELLLVSDADAVAEAAALLVKYKNPLTRITSMSLSGTEPGVLSHMIGREIGDKIRVFRRPVGGGSAIDQSCWIRKISLSGSDDDPYLTCTWALAQR